MSDSALSVVDPLPVSVDTYGAVPETPVVLTLEQVAERLQVSERSVLRMIERGELAAVKIGRLTRIPVASFNAYARAHGIDAPDDPAAPAKPTE